MTQKPSKTRALSLADALGYARLAAEGGEGITRTVARMHDAVLDMPGLAPFARGMTGDIAGLVYGAVGGGFRLTAKGVGAAIERVGAPDDRPMSRSHEAALAALNGVVGDHLAETGNPLALKMRFRSGGHSLTLEKQELARAFPTATGKVVALVHGLCMSDLQWKRGNHDHGAALARDFGYAPVALSYNTGLHVSTNGRAFAEALEHLVAAWPVEIDDLVIVGHSMGGLVARSACLAGESSAHIWRKRLRKIVFLGTPHHGAPLERIGSWMDAVAGKIPFAAVLQALGKARSAGVTDLRYGSICDEDWQGRDRFARAPDPRRPTPLPEGVACYAIAATLASAPGEAKDLLLGDGLVPVMSALGRHQDPHRILDFPRERQWIACETGHFDLLSSAGVYKTMANWLDKDV